MEHNLNKVVNRLIEANLAVRDDFLSEPVRWFQFQSNSHFISAFHRTLSCLLDIGASIRTATNGVSGAKMTLDEFYVLIKEHLVLDTRKEENDIHTTPVEVLVEFNVDAYNSRGKNMAMSFRRHNDQVVMICYPLHPFHTQKPTPE